MRYASRRRLGIWAAAVALAAALPARGQGTAIQRHEFSVITGDGVSIHVIRKFRQGSPKAPVLLVHGTFGNSLTWDLPGRSVMDYLAARGYDAYALDLRGMGKSDKPPNYFTIGLLDRVRDVVAVAGHIVANTGRKPVIAGWSQGGFLAGLAAAQAPFMFAGIGLFSVTAENFYLPPELETLFSSVLASGIDRYLVSPEILYAGAFGLDPLTGKPTMNSEAFQAYFSQCEADSVRAVVEEYSRQYCLAVIAPIWPTIRIPALVVDGALDISVGAERAQALFEALGSERKELTIFPRNAHGWFLEDNSEATLRVFDRFLAQFQ